MQKIFLLLISVFILSNSFAQTTPAPTPAPTKQQKVNLSLFAGTGVMWAGSQSKNDVTSHGVKMLFNYGLNMDFRLGDNYDLATGINHLMGGAGLTYQGDSINFKSLVDTVKDRLGANAQVKYKLQYIQIPFLLKLKTNEIGYSTYFVEFGVTPGVAIKAHADFKTNGNINPTDVSFTKDVNLFNFEFTAGAGWRYSLTGNTSVIVGLQFHNGLLDYTRNYKENNVSKAVLRSFTLSAGLGF